MSKYPHAISYPPCIDGVGDSALQDCPLCVLTAPFCVQFAISAFAELDVGHEANRILPKVRQYLGLKLEHDSATVTEVVLVVRTRQGVGITGQHIVEFYGPNGNPVGN